MSVSQKQIDFIKSLSRERASWLSENKPEWYKAPQTSREASSLINLLMRAPRDPKPVDEATQKEVNALRAVLNALNVKDAGFARSLIDQFDQRGSLSDKQMTWVRTLADRAENPKAEPVVGIHFVDGEYISVYQTKTGRLAGRRLHIVNGKGSFEYEAGILGKYDLSEATILTQEQASVFGRTHGFCVFCCRDLTDDRSLAVGYGPTCASNHDLPYPSIEEASAILNRPVSITA